MSDEFSTASQRGRAARAKRLADIKDGTVRRHTADDAQAWLKRQTELAAAAATKAAKKGGAMFSGLGRGIGVDDYAAGTEEAPQKVQAEPVAEAPPGSELNDLLNQAKAQQSQIEAVIAQPTTATNPPSTQQPGPAKPKLDKASLLAGLSKAKSNATAMRQAMLTAVTEEEEHGNTATVASTPLDDAFPGLPIAQPDAGGEDAPPNEDDDMVADLDSFLHGSR